MQRHPRYMNADARSAADRPSKELQALARESSDGRRPCLFAGTLGMLALHQRANSASDLARMRWVLSQLTTTAGVSQVLNQAVVCDLLVPVFRQVSCPVQRHEELGLQLCGLVSSVHCTPRCPPGEDEQRQGMRWQPCALEPGKLSCCGWACEQCTLHIQMWGTASGDAWAAVYTAAGQALLLLSPPCEWSSIRDALAAVYTAACRLSCCCLRPGSDFGVCRGTATGQQC